ncbi:MAG: hypothetical protein N4A54_01730 [Peptostreptococcaceae bacterium]|nr:hypothetical protein [Peptostreptococcaceae bacterium]
MTTLTVYEKNNEKLEAFLTNLKKNHMRVKTDLKDTKAFLKVYKYDLNRIEYLAKKHDILISC